MHIAEQTKFGFMPQLIEEFNPAPSDFDNPAWDSLLIVPIKDFTPNGADSYSTVVLGNDGNPVELQARGAATVEEAIALTKGRIIESFQRFREEEAA